MGRGWWNNYGGGWGGLGGGKGRQKKRKRARRVWQPARSQNDIDLDLSLFGLNHLNRPGPSTSDYSYLSQPEPINLEDLHDLEDETDGEILFGNLRGNIVGIQYYRGTVNNGEMVSLVREPNNKYDPNAVKVTNVDSVQVGHIKRELARALANVMDKKLARVEGVVPFGSTNVYSMPVDLTLWGKLDDKDIVLSKLAGFGYHLRPPKEAAKPAAPGLAGFNNLLDTRRVFLSPAEVKGELDKVFEGLKEGDKTSESEPAAAIVTTMYPHQKQALHWMIARENGLSLPPFWEKRADGQFYNTITVFTTNRRPKNVYGGILADDMGLGKTLEMIALILTNFDNGKPLAVPVAGVYREAKKTLRKTKSTPVPLTKKDSDTPGFEPSKPKVDLSKRLKMYQSVGPSVSDTPPLPSLSLDSDEDIKPAGVRIKLKINKEDKKLEDEAEESMSEEEEDVPLNDELINLAADVMVKAEDPDFEPDVDVTISKQKPGLPSPNIRSRPRRSSRKPAKYQYTDSENEEENTPAKKTKLQVVKSQTVVVKSEGTQPPKTRKGKGRGKGKGKRSKTTVAEAKATCVIMSEQDAGESSIVDQTQGSVSSVVNDCKSLETTKYNSPPSVDKIVPAPHSENCGADSVPEKPVLAEKPAACTLIEKPMDFVATESSVKKADDLHPITTTLPGGITRLVFPDGRVETTFPSGIVQTILPSGAVKTSMPTAGVQTILPNSQVTVEPFGEKNKHVSGENTHNGESGGILCAGDVSEYGETLFSGTNGVDLHDRQASCTNMKTGSSVQLAFSPTSKTHQAPPSAKILSDSQKCNTSSSANILSGTCNIQQAEAKIPAVLAEASAAVSVNGIPMISLLSPPLDKSPSGVPKVSLLSRKVSSSDTTSAFSPSSTSVVPNTGVTVVSASSKLQVVNANWSSVGKPTSPVHCDVPSFSPYVPHVSSIPDKCITSTAPSKVITINSQASGATKSQTISTSVPVLIRVGSQTVPLTASSKATVSSVTPASSQKFSVLPSSTPKPSSSCHGASRASTAHATPSLAGPSSRVTPSTSGKSSGTRVVDDPESLTLSQVLHMRKTTPGSVKPSTSTCEDNDELPDIYVIDDDDDQNTANTYTAGPPAGYSHLGRTEAEGARGTLIICPLSVMSNWINQIEEHVHENVKLEVYMYYGSGRVTSPKFLKNQDIVLTTYSTIAMDYKGRHPLKHIEWLRIVLDEGHAIRNPNAQQTKAIMELKARRKWVLTGTPIQNSMKDLWSIVNFLGISPFTDKQWWHRTIERPLTAGENCALQRVRHLMGMIALRRTKTQKVNGKPLLTLPERNVFVEHIKLSDEERKVYDSMQNNGQIVICKYFNQGTLLHHYGEVLAILMRLRQLCCHPQLVAKAAAAAAEAIETAPKDTTEDEMRQRLVQTLLEVLHSGSDEECSICLDSLRNPVITPCAHVYCRACIEAVIRNEAPQSKCPLCRGDLNADKLIEVPPEEEAPQKQTFTDGDWQSSAKVDALLNALITVRQQDPSTKSLVVSQFTSLLRLLEIPLRKQGFTFTKLDGTMSAVQREQSIEKFSETGPGTPDIMLLSLKAGGVGINLTAASQVFLMDPAWNPASEEQCFDRCHRLGQTKDVTITKFVIEDSVEERMLALQEKKRQLMQGAFGKKQNAEQRREQRINDIRNLINL